MGKYFDMEQKDSDSEKYQAWEPECVYGKAGKSATAAILILFLGPLLSLAWLIPGAGQEARLVCGVVAFCLAVAFIGYLISAVEQYCWAKDAERDAVLERLDRINRSLER